MIDYKIIQAMTTEEFKRYLNEHREHFWKVVPHHAKVEDAKYGIKKVKPFSLKWIPQALLQNKSQQ